MEQIDDHPPVRSARRAGTRRRRRIAALAGALTLVTGAGAATVASVSVADTPTAQQASEKPARIVQVSGELIPQDTIGVEYKVRGELIGTWTFPLNDAITLYASDTRIIQKGIEYFRGCLNTNGNKVCDSFEPTGGWRGDYIYWASRDARNRLVKGGCTHAMNGGGGAFRGVRGLLHMTDVYASTAAGSTTFYEGEVILNAVQEPAVDTLRRSAASGTSAAVTAIAKIGC